MEVLIIGGSGLAGSNVVRRFREEGFEVSGTYNNRQTEEATVQLDKEDEAAVTGLITDTEPEVVIDLAAFHNVDECEIQRGKAWSINATGTANVVAAAAEVDAHFIFLSTDYVFSGESEEVPYTETSPVNPVNYYGQTKYAGEQAAKVTNKWTVLRSSVLYGTHRENFLTWALSGLRTDNRVEVVDDQISTVTYVGDIAEACVRVADRELFGLYHAAGPESVSRYRFTRQVASAFGYPPQAVVPVSTAELGQEAIRPQNSSLDSEKLYEDIGYRFKRPKTALEILTS